jgi:hypothetical protein
MSGLEQPKKPAGGGFGRFVAEKRSEFQAKCAGQPVSAVSKMAGLAWKALSEAAQQPYKTKFLEAQKKYEVDMVAFLAAGGEKQKGAAALRTEKRKAKEGTLKKQKDPNAPKRPAGGAYGCFIAANRAEFTKQCPGSITGVAKLAGEKWKAVSVAEKEKYEKIYKVKFDAYQEAMKSYVPPAIEKNDEDIEETPAKKAKISQEDKASAKEDKKAAIREKKAAAANKKATKSVGKKSAFVETMLVEIPQTVLAKADKAGMTGALKKLLCRDDIKGAKISPSAAMSALEGAGGLLHKARRELLGE